MDDRQKARVDDLHTAPTAPDDHQNGVCLPQNSIRLSFLRSCSIFPSLVVCLLVSFYHDCGEQDVLSSYATSL